MIVPKSLKNCKTAIDFREYIDRTHVKKASKWGGRQFVNGAGKQNTSLYILIKCLDKIARKATPNQADALKASLSKLKELDQSATAQLKTQTRFAKIITTVKQFFGYSAKARTKLEKRIQQKINALSPQKPPTDKIPSQPSLIEKTPVEPNKLKTTPHPTAAALNPLQDAAYDSVYIDFSFVYSRAKLASYYSRPDVIMIASAGRSGSTLMTDAMVANVSDRKILKTHLLPPDNRFHGKIIFIFSNPDKAAESVLHRCLNDKSFFIEHFEHIETSDIEWLNNIKLMQTEEQNLLSYDALGCHQHLQKWFSLKHADLQNAQVLAIKYENLWDNETIQTLKEFLKTENLNLPKKIERGHNSSELNPVENSYRNLYNLGSFENPRYKAYDQARILWEKAPPYQYFSL